MLADYSVFRKRHSQRGARSQKRKDPATPDDEIVSLTGFRAQILKVHGGTAMVLAVFKAVYLCHV